jgi:hypothetical protein
MIVIKRLKKMVLLEDETGYRFYVPRDVYENEEISNYEADAIPYSLQFDLILNEIIDTSAIASDLYRAGVHTETDVLNSRKIVNDVLRRHLSDQNIIKTFRGGK